MSTSIVPISAAAAVIYARQRSAMPDEFELKFEVPAEHAGGLGSALARGRVRVERIRAIYFDTADGCLGSRGVSIRLRHEGRQWVQTAKAATADPLCRLEHNVVVRPPAGRTEPRLDLSLHGGTPVGLALWRAMEKCHLTPGLVGVEEQFRTDVSRFSRTVRVAGARVALSFDRGAIVAAGRSVPVCEFELELKAGDPVSLIALSKRWAGLHGMRLSTASKAERGMRLARGETFGPPVETIAAPVAKSADARSFLDAAIQSCMLQILGNASEIGAGALDEELVHQLRVGLVHLRTVLDELQADRFGVDPAWAKVLRSVFRELGAHRDREVVVPAVLTRLFRRGCLPLHHAGQATAIRSPHELVRDPALQQTFLGILAFLHRPPDDSNGDFPDHASARILVAAKLDELHRLIAHDVARFPDLRPSLQHRVRKRLGRMLCIGAAAESLFARKHVERYLAGLRRARSLIGKGNDFYVTAEALRSRALRGPGASFAKNWLSKRRRTIGKQCHRSLRKAMGEPVFWRP